MNHLACEYLRADRLGSFDRLKGVAKSCSHVKLAQAAGAGGVEILMCADRPCLRQDNVLGKDCGKQGEHQFWVIAKLVPASCRRPVEGVFIKCKVIARKPDLLKLRLSSESGGGQEIALPPLYLGPFYSKRKPPQKLVESEHIDDQPVLYVCDPGENLLFLKVGLEARIGPNLERHSNPKLQHIEFELTIPQRSRTMTKTVVEVDMVCYGDIARILEESAGTETVAQLNEQIQGFIDQGLACVALPRDRTVVKTTGDGAILVFEHANQAHVFVEALHNATATYNTTKTESSAKRCFRSGVATGDITVLRHPDGTSDIAGTTIARAVRLEAAGNPGEVLVDTFTYDALPADLKLRYKNEEEVRGKRDETFRVRRWVIIACEIDQRLRTRTPRPTVASVDRHTLLELLKKLYPEAMLDKLMFLLEIPVDHQPSRNLNHAERCMQVVHWAVSPTGCGLERLQSELQYLIDHQ